MSAIVFFSFTWQWFFCQCMLQDGIWWITITLLFADGCFCTRQNEQWEFGLKKKKKNPPKNQYEWREEIQYNLCSGAKPLSNHSTYCKSFQYYKCFLMDIGFRCLFWAFASELELFLSITHWYTSVKTCILQNQEVPLLSKLNTTKTRLKTQHSVLIQHSVICVSMCH